MKRFLLLLGLYLTSVAGYSQCQANFGFTVNGNVVNFTDSSTTASGNIISWIWQFGDLSAPGTQQNPVHTYTACGYYPVSLTIATNSFCTSTFTDTVFVNGGVTGSFTATVDTVTGSVSFQAQPVGSGLVYAWDFGDNNSGTGAAPVHQYAAAGTYTVCLVVGDAGGICTDTVCNIVSVTIAPPNCNATWTNTSPLNGQQIFTASPFNLNWTYSWDFGDQTTGNGFVANHTYTTSGTYTVCLTVYDSATTCTSQFCDTVNINLSTTCPVTFTNVLLMGNMTFTAQPFNPLNTYSWTFGDNTTGTGPVTTHTYAAPGTYTVCVTMNTFDGCTSTFCDTVIVPSAIGYNEYSQVFSYAQVYPVPANEQINIEFATSSSEVVAVITDITGRLMWSGQYGVTPEQINRIIVDCSAYASGTYFVNLQAGEQNMSLKFVK